MRLRIDADNRHLTCQDRPQTRAIRALLIVSVPLLPISVFAAEMTFDTDGSRNVSCACIVATSGCTSRFLDAVSGSQRHEWVSTAYARKGGRLDLTLYCYRKRDVVGEGQGLCCQASNEAESLGMFEGTLQE